MTKGNPKWEQFERSVQELLTLRSIPGSGSQWYDPSDGKSEPEDPYSFMVDCKHTEHKTFTLDAKMLQKWWEKATGLGCHFALPVRFEGSEGSQKEWVTITLDDYAELVDAVRIINGPNRCADLPHVTGERSIFVPATLPCCRRQDHYGHHDNGEVEWSV